MPDSPKDMDSWARTLYTLAHSDTRWAKERSWQAVAWCFGLDGGLLSLYRYPFAGAALWPFNKLVLGIGFLTILYLWHLHSFAAGARRTTDKLRPEEFSEVTAPRGDDRDHALYLSVHILAVTIGTVVALCGLYWIRSHTCLAC